MPKNTEKSGNPTPVCRETGENPTPVRRPKRALTLAAGLCLLFCLLFTLLPRESFGDTLAPLGDILVRATAAAAVLCLLLREGMLRLSVRLDPKTPLTLAATVAVFFVALNNFPFENLLSGRAQIALAPLPLLWHTLSVLATALFEEALFRGLLLPLFLERAKPTRRALLAALLLSSALFGGLHLVNLAVASPAATLLQVAYTFGIGLLASLLYLLSRSILLPVLFHALYNFGGLFLSAMGGANTPTLGTVLFTAALATGAGLLALLALFDYAHIKFTNK